MCTLRLPSEMWTHIFRHISLSDRLCVRATCKYFRDLVDNCLLSSWTVQLKRSSGIYEEDFWRLLRRWKVTSMLLQSPLCWAQLAKELPGLTDLMIIHNCWMVDYHMQDLKGFTNLQRLHHTLLPSPISLNEFSLMMPPQLTHLMLCHDMFVCNIIPREIPPCSQLKKLKSFTFHSFFESHPIDVLHFILSSLPQLQHFSLSIWHHAPYEGNVLDLLPLHNYLLHTLELVECEPCNLPADLMKMIRPLPFLQKLSIFCVDSNPYLVDQLFRLSTWLKDLNTLSSLVVRDKELSDFVESIPSSVTDLSLFPQRINADEMTALSKQLPNLRHLHLETIFVFLGSDIVLIPQLFPKLRTLRILFRSRHSDACGTHEEIPEDAFLSLASLRELEVLEIVDVELVPTELLSKLRALTKDRRWICRRAKDQILSCPCTVNI